MNLIFTNRILDLSNKLIFLGFLFVLIIPFSIFLESVTEISYLPTLSFILLFLIIFFNIIVGHKNISINPFSVFSFMYSGFVFGGFYYSFSGGYYGKFVGFLGLESNVVEDLFLNGQIFAIICFVMFSIGYILFFKRNETFLTTKSTMMYSYPIFKSYLSVSYSLMLVGVLYWIWVCYQLAGGVIEALMLFQVFPHLVKEEGISTLPYHLYYAGVYILLIGTILNDKKIGYLFVLVSAIGFFISISTARITISVTFLLTQLFLIYLLMPNLRKRMIKFVGFFFLLAFVIYFLRIMSNLYFLGKEFSINEIDFFKTIIGSGNITDLQQLVIIFYAFDINNSMLGLTYSDWARNSFVGFFGIEPSSVGLIIKEKFVPANSGAPTPSAIGEAFVNFNYGAPFFMFLVGVMFAFLNNWANQQKNIIYLFIYVNFVVNFIFMYPKVDSTMFSNFFWSFFPTVLIIFAFSYFYLFLKASLCRKSPT